jgi:hypothetical protein
MVVFKTKRLKFLLSLFLTGSVFMPTVSYSDMYRLGKSLVIHTVSGAMGSAAGCVMHRTFKSSVLTALAGVVTLGCSHISLRAAFCSSDSNFSGSDSDKIGLFPGVISFFGTLVAFKHYKKI